MVPTEVAQQLPILVAQELAPSWRYRSAVFNMSKSEVEFLFELSERRFDCTSTIFCTLYDIYEDWNKRLGRGTQAESIVERYKHNSDVIEMGDLNMRELFENPRKKRK